MGAQEEGRTAQRLGERRLPLCCYPVALFQALVLAGCVQQCAYSVSLAAAEFWQLRGVMKSTGGRAEARLDNGVWAFFS